jgi:hypothetical protein
MKLKIRWLSLLILLVLLPLLSWQFVRSHPLVFIPTHAHCIKYAGLVLLQYADEHKGKFPSDPNGYGDALLKMDEDCYNVLTGPGYDPADFHRVKMAGETLPEAKCGRVYIQGLTTKANPEIAILFDKLATPGGDHCGLPARLWAQKGREVCYVNGSMDFIRESEWPDFAKNQIEILLREGFERQVAEALYHIPYN